MIMTVVSTNNKRKKYATYQQIKTECNYVNIVKGVFEKNSAPIRRVKCKVAGMTISHISCNERQIAAKKYDSVRDACKGCEHFNE